MKQTRLKNGEIITIREANKSDASNLINYISKIGGESEFLTFSQNEFDITVEEEEAIIDSHTGVDNKLFIIAEAENQIVGSLNYGGGIRQRTKHTGEFGVSVAKEYWGLGIGKELIMYMVDWAREGNVVKKINLRVREDNEMAINLYRKLGFKEEGIISREFYVDKKYYSSILMGLEIDNDHNKKSNQPEYIDIDMNLRLKRFKGKFDFALDWYKDEETVKLVDGENAQSYDIDKLERMYKYLDKKGELYFIEVKVGNKFFPIGDVTFWKEDMPIVVGHKDYRGKGIGYKVIMALIQRARILGYDEIYVNEIYSYNIASQRAFEKAGFRKYKQNKNGYSYILQLK